MRFPIYMLRPALALDRGGILGRAKRSPSLLGGAKTEVVGTLYVAPLHMVGWISHAVSEWDTNICATVHTTTASAQSVMLEATATRGLGVLARGCVGTALLGAQCRLHSFVVINGCLLRIFSAESFQCLFTAQKINQTTFLASCLVVETTYN